MLWHHKCNDIQSTSHPMTVILPSHGTIVVFSVIDLRWSMINVFFRQLCLLLCHLFGEKYSSVANTKSGCTVTVFAPKLFLGALKQQRRMSITSQSITSLIRMVLLFGAFPSQCTSAVQGCAKFYFWFIWTVASSPISWSFVSFAPIAYFLKSVTRISAFLNFDMNHQQDVCTKFCLEIYNLFSS